VRPQTEYGILASTRFHVTLDRDEDGVWVAECLSIPGCVSQGTTKAEALDNVREAIALCLEVRAERGISDPKRPGAALRPLPNAPRPSPHASTSLQFPPTR